MGVLSLIANASLYERLCTFPKTVLIYLKLLILPFPLHMEYHFVETSIFTPTVLFGVPISLFIIYYLSKQINSSKALFYLLWFVIGLIPISNIVSPLASTIREHWMYIPSIGLFLLVFEAFQSIFVKQSYFVKWVLRVLPLAVFVSFSILTIHRNEQWGNEFVFYTHDLTYEPNSFVMENNLGAHYLFKKNDRINAKAHFKKSVEVSPNKNYSTALNNYGYMIELEGDVSLAAQYYYRSIKTTHYYLGYNNLSRLFLNAGQFKEALSLIQEGLTYYPYNFQLMLAQARATIGLADIRTSIQIINWLERINPTHRAVLDLKKKLRVLKNK
jgi:protein O-mannosyl-transferase